MTSVIKVLMHRVSHARGISGEGGKDSDSTTQFMCNNNNSSFFNVSLPTSHTHSVRPLGPFPLILEQVTMEEIEQSRFRTLKCTG